MYVFDNRYIEVIFKKENFRHLTGIDTNLSANQFYQYAVKGKLEASQIWFSSAHPYDLCIRKVQHIGNTASMASSECFLLEEVKTDTMAYKFGTTDLKFTLCLNRKKNQNGVEKSECYLYNVLSSSKMSSFDFPLIPSCFKSTSSDAILFINSRTSVRTTSGT